MMTRPNQHPPVTRADEDRIVTLYRQGDHEWLDRPESDTRECLICGMEVSG